MGRAMKIAILDDYQQVAMQSADWKSLPAGTEVHSFAENIAEPADLIKKLQPYDVVIAMRERTRFPAQVIDALPNLKLMISTGGRNPSIDAEACKRRNIALASGPLPQTESRPPRSHGRSCRAGVQAHPQSQPRAESGSTRRT